jgi:hypothetical protein
MGVKIQINTVAPRQEKVESYLQLDWRGFIVQFYISYYIHISLCLITVP